MVIADSHNGASVGHVNHFDQRDEAVYVIGMYLITVGTKHIASALWRQLKIRQELIELVHGQGAI